MRLARWPGLGIGIYYTAIKGDVVRVRKMNPSPSEDDEDDEEEGE